MQMVVDGKRPTRRGALHNRNNERWSATFDRSRYFERPIPVPDTLTSLAGEVSQET